MDKQTKMHVRKRQEKVSSNDDVVDKENTVENINFSESGNKSDDSSSQAGSEDSRKVGVIRLVSLSTLIDKPKAWVKEALMEPEIIELNSDDDDDVIITESENKNNGENKLIEVKSETSELNSLQTKRTDTLLNKVKSNFSAFNENLSKKKEKQLSKEKNSSKTYHSNFKSCVVVLEKMDNLENLKSKTNNVKESSSSEDEEIPLAKLKTVKKINKNVRQSEMESSDFIQENESVTLLDSESENEDKGSKTRKTKKTTDSESEKEMKKADSKRNQNKEKIDSESVLKKSRPKKSQNKKIIDSEADNDEEKSKERQFHNKKSVESDSEGKKLRTKKLRNKKAMDSDLDHETTKIKKSHSEKTIDSDSDREEIKSKTKKSQLRKTVDSESDIEKKNSKTKKSQNRKTVDSESSSKEKKTGDSELDSDENITEIKKPKDKIMHSESENEEKQSTSKKTSNEENTIDSGSENECEDKNGSEKSALSKESRTKQKVAGQKDAVKEVNKSTNNENSLKIIIKKDKNSTKHTITTRKRVISSESESESVVKDSADDSKNMSTSGSDNEKTVEQPAKSSSNDKIVNKKKRTRIVASDESDNDFYPTTFKTGGGASLSSDQDEKTLSDDETQKKKVRRRIRTTKDSNDSSSGSEKLDSKGQSRKKIRKVLKDESLSKETKNAAKEEMERRRRIIDRQKLYNEICRNHLLEKKALEKVVLDFDPDLKKDLISVHPKLVSSLKPHQANGIKFMWDCCFESLEHSKESKGSGCILAHCMGLGKTLQVVTLIHTLITHEETNINKVMVVCPLSTVLNWVNEFNIWLSKINRGEDVNVYEITKYKKMIDRSYQIKDWHENGGVLVIGYEMFRNLTCTTNKRIRKAVLQRFQTGLVDPGPDLVVCDEGHLLKNEKARISIAMNRISTLRRIVLTGTPLQNNLKEYYCMIQFVKPNLLGTYKEYTNRFVNPIINGQYIDSTPRDIEIMKRRSHVLHKLLDGVVQRRDYAVLAPFLPPKQEYVLYLTLHPLQEKLYEAYMQNYSKRSQQISGGKAVALFSDFQELSRIWTHPRSLRFYSDKCEKDREKAEENDSESSIGSFICDDEDDASTTPDSSSDDSDYTGKKRKPKKRVTRSKVKEDKVETLIEDSDSDCQVIEDDKEKEKKEFPSDWWCKYVDDTVLEDITYSSKLVLFFGILKKCEEIGDKVLVFSQSLFSLNLIEYFLDKIDYASQNKTKQTGWLAHYSSSWSLGLDYFRLDGSASVDNRASWCKLFNDVKNPRARLFLISTKAGGLGINLVAANRVIIFDVSWNPSHDIQSIFRVYRFGQTKPCYIYRFIAMGTMEEKVYERQVTKLAISKRVIDEHQIDRHYNQNDLNELYKFTPLSGEEKPIPMVPKDRLLAETLQECDKQIFKYHEHDSLLEHKEDEELDEEERKAAWDEFENEKQQKPIQPSYPQFSMMNNMNGFQMGLQDTTRAIEMMLRQRNPTWTDLQIQQSIPILLQQLYQFTPGFQQGFVPPFPYQQQQQQPGFPQPNTSMMQQ